MLEFPVFNWLLEPLIELVVVARERLDGEGPPVEADTVPAVDKKPFISLRSFCLFFFPPGPRKRYFMTEILNCGSW